MIQIPSESFFEMFKKTPGALSCCEAIALHNICLQALPGNFIECGSNAGKSGSAASSGLPSGTFYMVDPIFDLTNLEAWTHTIQGHPGNLAWGYVKDKDFKEEVKKRILLASNSKVEPILCGTFSEDEIPKHSNYSYAFIDSDSHQAERVNAELELLKPRMIKGGIIAFHDVDNQYIAPRQALNQLIASGEYENIDIGWEEIFNYVRENNLEEENNSWHSAGSEEFPKFVGAVRKK